MKILTGFDKLYSQILARIVRLAMFNSDLTNASASPWWWALMVESPRPLWKKAKAGIRTLSVVW
jgi:hypothetical protein